MHGNALISDIRGLFPKDNAQWLNWIVQGKLLYINKEKVQNLINQQRRNLADVKYLDLDHVAKLIKDFDNPQINTKTNSENDISFRNGEGASNSQLTEQQRKEMREFAEKIAKEFSPL